MPESSPVVAILTADWHLCHKAPLARSGESDWYEAQARSVREVQELVDKYSCPIVLAGDVMDKWNSPAELINFAAETMRNHVYYPIPGQHDLPYHCLEAIKKSAYWTLVETGVLANHMETGVALWALNLHPFPFGVEVTPLENPFDLVIEVAVVHKYLYTNERNCYRGASEEGRLSKGGVEFEGYDVVVSGDNHIPFDYEAQNGTRVFNCGSLHRRTIAQRDYKPSVGLLHQNGTITRHYLDISQDKFIEPGDVSKDTDIDQFVEALKNLVDTATNFKEAVDQFVAKEKVPGVVVDKILKAMEEK